MGNLRAQISTLEKIIPQSDPRGDRHKQIVELLLLRADLGGRLADYDRAAELAEPLPTQYPNNPVMWVVRAKVRSALHRLEEASADLDEAEKRGVSPKSTRSIRVSTLAARGKLPEALALQTQAHAESPDIDSKGVLAALLGDANRKEEAIPLFREAFSSFQDTSPFPVAWLFFREGQMWERELRKDLAMAYYRAALERLPAYAHAAIHLARLSPPNDADTILKPLLQSSDDPDIFAVLADKARERGESQTQADYTQKAAARYEELMGRHPAAFADHAAQFWLDTGNDPQKALVLARRNLEVRKTVRAYQLAVLSAMSANDRAAACQLGTEALPLPGMTPVLRDVIQGACEKR